MDQLGWYQDRPVISLMMRVARGRPSGATFAVRAPRPGDEVAVILLFRRAEPAGTAAEHGRARADVRREEWS